jgi:exopolysaccharide biosynthesis protein
MHQTNKPTKEVHMLNKTTIALAMALTLGVSSAALAAKGGGAGAEGNREFGAPGQTASSGVNPSDHRSLRGGKKVEVIMSDGKCWQDYQWSSCRR